MIKIQPVFFNTQFKQISVLWYRLIEQSTLGELLRTHMLHECEILPSMYIGDITHCDPGDFNDSWILCQSPDFFGTHKRNQKYLAKNFRLILNDYEDSNCLHLQNFDLNLFQNARDVWFAGSNISSFQSAYNIHNIFINNWAGISIAHDPFLTNVVQDPAAKLHAEKVISQGAQDRIQIPCSAPRPCRVHLLDMLWKKNLIPSCRIDWSLMFLPSEIQQRKKTLVNQGSISSCYSEYDDFLTSGLVPKVLDLENIESPMLYDPESYDMRKVMGGMAESSLAKYGWYIAAETFSENHHVTDWGRMSHITEKSYKGFLQGSNTVVLGAPGHEAKLREQGFWLPDYGIDHLDGLERAQTIADLIPEMLADTRDYTDERIHNFRLVTDPEWLIQQAVGDLITKLSPTPGLAVP